VREMSLESARKLGLAASLLNIILPVAIVGIYFVFLFSMFLSLFSLLTPRYASPNYLFVGGVFVFGFIAIAVLAVAAIITFMVAMHRLSKFYQTPAIFSNILKGFLINIGAGVTAVIFILVIVIFSIANSRSSPFNPVFSSGNSGIALLEAIIGVIIIVYALNVVSAYFYRKGFNTLRDKSGIGDFGTAGLLYLIGGVLGAGGIITWIGWIFAAVGFNKLGKPQPQPYFTGQMPPYQYNAPQTKYCTNCGAPNRIDSGFCVNCGKPLQNP
jgi:uncharacterized membrane protein